MFYTELYAYLKQTTVLYEKISIYFLQKYETDGIILHSNMCIRRLHFCLLLHDKLMNNKTVKYILIRY
jgi:hypothetical protein